MKKSISIVLLFAMLLGLMTGCGKTKTVTDVELPEGEFTEGSVHGQVFTWAGTADIAFQEQVDAQNRINAEYSERTGNVRVNLAFTYDLELIVALKEGNTMPTVFEAPNSDAQKLIKNGYSRDIQALLDERGWTSDMWVSQYAEQLMDKNGHMHGIPKSVSTRALFCNVAIFEEAGLVDAAGNLMYPKTWDELVDAAYLIREKTGKNGFALSLYDEVAMRDYVNTAWNYGADPSVNNGDGTFTAEVNSPEMLAATQMYAKLGRSDVAKINPNLSDSKFCTQSVAYGESAMCITDGRIPVEMEVTSEGYAMYPVPAGPADNKILVAGNAYWFSPTATDDEVRAALDFIEMYGIAPVWSEDQHEALREEARNQIATTGVYLHGISVFTGERREKALEAAKEFDDSVSKYYRVFVDSCQDESRYRFEEEGDPFNLYGTLVDPLQEAVTDMKADIQYWLDQADEQYQAFLDYELIVGG